MRGRLAVLLAALAASLGIGIISVRYAEQNAAILNACGAVESGDWNSALEQTENLALDRSSARDAAECRCIALVATDRGAECESLMDRLLSDPAFDGWSPSPALAVHLIQARRSAGRIEAAAESKTKRWYCENWRLESIPKCRRRPGCAPASPRAT